MKDLSEYTSSRDESGSQLIIVEAGDLPDFETADGHFIQEIGASATNAGIFFEGICLKTGEWIREKASDFYFPQSEDPTN